MSDARAWLAAAFVVLEASLLARVPHSPQAATPKPSFDVVSIKPSAPLNPTGPIRIGGGARGNRYVMSNSTLRMLLQTAYRPPSEGPGQLQIFGAPNWVDADRYDIEATVDCSGGLLSPAQVPLMVQSMLEDRFQLKAHMETRELPIYNLVVGKDGPKIKASADQTPPGPGRGGPALPCGPVPEALATPPPPPLPPPPPGPGGRGGPADPNFVMPRGAIMTMVSAGSQTVRASAVALSTLVGMLQQQLGRPVVDKTGLTGLFDYTLQFSREGLPTASFPGAAPAAPGTGINAAGGTAGVAPVAADPVASLFTALQEFGLRLESARGPVNVLVVDSVQKPSPN